MASFTRKLEGKTNVSINESLLRTVTLYLEMLLTVIVCKTDFQQGPNYQALTAYITKNSVALLLHGLISMIIKSFKDNGHKEKGNIKGNTIFNDHFTYLTILTLWGKILSAIFFFFLLECECKRITFIKVATEYQ